METNINSCFDALKHYRDIKQRCMEWNKKHYSGRRNTKRKTPWYMITTGKQYNYEERKEPYGTAVKYYRVRSQAAKFYDKTIIRKMTHENYVELLINAKLQDWIKKHPCPIDVHSIQKDLFEDEYMAEWNENKQKALENITKNVRNVGNKIIVYARYKGDIGYPHKIKELKPDNKQFIVENGMFINRKSKSIITAQKCANKMTEDPNFISLMLVYKQDKCIIVPQSLIKLAA